MKVSRDHGCFKIRQKKRYIKWQMQNQKRSYHPACVGHYWDRRAVRQTLSDTAWPFLSSVKNPQCSGRLVLVCGPEDRDKGPNFCYCKLYLTGATTCLIPNQPPAKVLSLAQLVIIYNLKMQRTDDNLLGYDPKKCFIMRTEDYEKLMFVTVFKSSSFCRIHIQLMWSFTFQPLWSFRHNRVLHNEVWFFTILYQI